MGDKIIEVPNSSSSSVSCEKMASPEPVRSRWTPKPEQILILESIFNSGMVNPPKDETVRIRKLLEKFGAVGDANVFYWFQNRRSRSRRRQRQMQAGMTSSPGLTRPGGSGGGGGGVILCEPTSLTSPSSTNSSSSNSSGGSGFLTTSPVSNSAAVASCSPKNLVGNDCADDLFTISRQMGFPEFGETPLQMLMPTSASLNYLHYQQQPAGPLTVFINGIPSEVPRGPIDTGTMFGNDVMLLHSSGEIVPSNEYGVLFQGLQMGESYFLVSKPTF